MKRRFAFRLARVRRIRELHERVARGTWAAAERAAREAEETRDVTSREVAEARARVARELGASTQRPLNTRGVLLSQRVVDAQVARLAACLETARTARIRARHLMAAWRERETDRRALEELEERARERHDHELERADQAELDEYAVMRARPGLPDPGRNRPQGLAPGEPEKGSSREGPQDD